MKTCTRCKLDKDATNFSRGKSTCKPCSSLVVQERNKTPIGVITMMYTNQRMTSRKMGRPDPDYTLQELRDWVLAQPNWQPLFDSWVDTGYAKEHKPSCDRINSSKPYTLCNLQLVTFKDNLANQKRDNLKGIHLGANGTKVKQLSLSGEFIAEHPSVLIAMRSLGKDPQASSNIHMVCKGKNKSAYGYKWEYV